MWKFEVYAYIHVFSIIDLWIKAQKEKNRIDEDDHKIKDIGKCKEIQEFAPEHEPCLFYPSILRERDGRKKKVPQKVRPKNLKKALNPRIDLSLVLVHVHILSRIFLGYFAPLQLQNL